MLMTWQWDDVRFFLAVARAGSLSGAARALGVGHVTVGRRITLLEKQLGVTLLNRTPDGFVTTSALVCRKLGEVAFSLYASKHYLARKGVPKQGQGLAGFDLITFTGAPTAMSPFFMGESLEGARIALRCDNPLIQLRAAASKGGIAEAACFLGDSAPDLVRVWPDKAPARRVVWLIMHQDMRRAARIRAVSSAITQAFRRQRRILEQRIAAG